MRPTRMLPSKVGGGHAHFTTLRRNRLRGSQKLAIKPPPPNSGLAAHRKFPNEPKTMIEVISNYGPNPAPPRYVYLGPKRKEENRTPTGKAQPEKSHEPISWGDFILLLMRTLMPFTEARQAVMAAVEQYEERRLKSPLLDISVATAIESKTHHLAPRWRLWVCVLG